MWKVSVLLVLINHVECCWKNEVSEKTMFVKKLCILTKTWKSTLSQALHGKKNNLSVHACRITVNKVSQSCPLEKQIFPSYYSDGSACGIG